MARPIILGSTPLFPWRHFDQPSNMAATPHCIHLLAGIHRQHGCATQRPLAAFVGYNLIYLDKLQRAGSVIDGVMGRNPGAKPQPNMNATRPAFEFQDGRFWAYGLNVGLNLAFKP